MFSYGKYKLIFLYLSCRINSMSIQIGAYDILANPKGRVFTDERLKLYSDTQSNLLEISSGCNETSMLLDNIQLSSSNNGSNIVISSLIGEQTYRLLDLSKDASVINSTTTTFEGNVSIACNITIIGNIINNQPIQTTSVTCSNIHLNTDQSIDVPFNISSNSEDILYLDTATERFIIQQNVGIGTTIPRYKLQVQGPVYTSDGIYGSFLSSNANSSTLQVYGNLNVNGSLSTTEQFNLGNTNLELAALTIVNSKYDQYPGLSLKQPIGYYPVVLINQLNNDGTSNTRFGISSSGRSYIGTDMNDITNFNLYEASSQSNAMLTIGLPYAFSNDSIMKLTSYDKTNTMIVSSDAYIGIGTTIVLHPLHFNMQSNTNMLSNPLSNVATIGIYHTDMPNKYFILGTSNNSTVFSIDGAGSLNIGSSVYLGSNGTARMNNLTTSNIVLYNSLTVGSSNVNFIGLGIVQGNNLISSNIVGSNVVSSSITNVDNILSSNINTSTLNVSSNATLYNVYVAGTLTGPNINLFVGESGSKYFSPAASNEGSVSHFKTSNVLVSIDTDYNAQLAGSISGNSNGVLQVRTYGFPNTPISAGVSVYGHDYSSMLVTADRPYYQLQRPGSRTYNIGINGNNEMYFGMSNNDTDYTATFMKISQDAVTLGNSKTFMYARSNGPVYVSTAPAIEPLLSNIGGFEVIGPSLFRTGGGATIMSAGVPVGNTNVGIGNTNPRRTLEVTGDTIVTGLIGIGTTIPISTLHVQGTSYISSSVGIGTTIPRRLLDVEGSIIVKNNIGVGTTIPRVALDVIGDVITKGNLGIGTTLTNGNALYMIGNAGITGMLTVSSNIYSTTGVFGTLFGVANSSTVASNSLGLVNTPNITVGTVISGSITTNNNAIDAGSGTVTAARFVGSLSGIANTSIFSSNSFYSSNSTFSSNLLGRPNISVGSINTNNGNITLGSGIITASKFEGNLVGVANSAVVASNALSFIGSNVLASSVFTSNAIVSGSLTASNMIVNGSNMTVNTYVLATSNVYINNITGTGPALSVYQPGSQYPIADFYDTNVSTTVPALRIARGRNIGIGTTLPVAPLHVEGNTYYSGNVGIGTTLPRKALDVIGDIIAPYNIGIGTTIPKAKLHVESTSYLGGNVGIGTTIPQQQLHVYGNMLVGTSTAYAGSNYLIPSANGRINNVSITALNSRTRTSYASASNSVSLWTKRDGTFNIYIGSLRTTDYQSICWSPELSMFCAVGDNGLGSGTASSGMISLNGAAWTSNNIDTSYVWTSVCWSPELGKLCAVSYHNEGGIFGSSARSTISTTGTSWTLNYVTNTPYLYSVCWAAELGLFCAVGYGTATSCAATSPDGSTWTSRSTPVQNTWRSVCWSPDLSLFCAVSSDGTNNQVMTSANGITWTTRAASGGYSICWSPELELFCVATDTTTIRTSPDGITWSDRTAPSSARSVVWAPELSLFCGVGTDTIISSPDGINWKQHPSPLYSPWNSICWSPELSIFAVVSDKGGTNDNYGSNVLTSSIAMPNSLNFVRSLPGQVFVDQLGNLGIGTTFPKQMLDVRGNVYIANNLGIGTTLPRRPLHVEGISYYATSVGIGTTQPRNMLDVIGDVIVSSNIGIGTTLPQTPLHVQDMSYFASSVGIGTTVPAGSLHVYGNAIIGTSTKYASNVTYTTNSVILPSASGRINNVSITALNARTRTSYINSSSCVSRWTTRSSPADNAWKNVCWSPELSLFVAVANAVSGTSRVMTSPDGIVWATSTVAGTGSWNCVAWSPSIPIFCALSSATQYLATSTNGTTWTTRSLTANAWQSVCWAPELAIFCAVASSGSGNRVAVSTNGTTWTTKSTSGFDNSWQSVCWSPDLSLFCAVAGSGTGNRVMTSPDGTTWTTRYSIADNNWTSVCWSPELCIFCAVSDTSAGSISSRVMTSTDGISWYARTAAADYDWKSVVWAAELSMFCAVSSSGTGQRVMTSYDGITWLIHSSAQDNAWSSVCFAPELSIFCAVASSGSTGSYIMTSDIGMPNSKNFVRALPGQLTVNVGSGNVGIGTTLPRQLLDVQGGNAIVSGNLGIGTTIPVNTLHVEGRGYYSTNVGIGTTVQRKALDVIGDVIISGNIGIGTTLPKAYVDIAAGTSSVAPLQLTSSGANVFLTNATAGAIEYDGTIFTMTPATSTRCVTVNEQIVILNTAYTLGVNTTAAQKIFNATASGAVGVPIGTHQFETYFVITGINTSSSTVGFSLAVSGGAVIGSQSWEAFATKTSALTGNSPIYGHFTAATTSITGTANTNTICVAYIKGTVKITTAGNLIPSVSFSSAPGTTASVNVNSYFKIATYNSTNAANITVGNWS